MASMLVGSALAELAGPQKDFWEKVGGSDGHVWIHAFKRFLRKENPWEGVPVWRTIKIGTGLRTADDFRRARREMGRKVSDWANDLLGRPQFVVAAEEGELDLAVATTKQLTGKDEATTAEVHAAIIALGGLLCPPEAGPQLRLQYENQPDGEWLLMAMEAIADSGGDLRVFHVGRDYGELWLNTRCGNPVDRWSAGTRWVFVIPRK